MKAYFSELAGQFTQPVTAIAQILGFIPLILGFFIFRNISRKTSIAIKAVSDFISAIHFLLLSQWTGCVINGINTFRGVCFAQRDRYTWASGSWMPILFCVMTVAGSALGWTGPESLLPMLGSCLAVIGYWCDEPGLLRKFNFAGIFLWTVYGVISFSVPTVVGNIISLTSIVITELRSVREKKEENHD